MGIFEGFHLKLNPFCDSYERHQWLNGLGVVVEAGVGETSPREVYTLPNLNLTNFGKFSVTNAESWQQFVSTQSREPPL